MRVPLRSALFAIMLGSGTAGAQPVVPGPAPAPPAATPAPPPAPGDEVSRLRSELEAQKAELAAQRAELAAQRAELAAQKSGPSAEGDVDPAELEAALAEAGAGASAGTGEGYEEEDVLDIYGFMDFGFDKTWVSDQSFLYGVVNTRSSTFVLGNLNLYFDAKPHEDLRGLLELRFVNTPHGQESFGVPIVPNGPEYSRVDRSTTDDTSPNGRNRILLANTQIERAEVTYTATQALQLKVGYFLTPFGIWNQDHGTPTLISLFLPDSQVVEYFPQRQIGVQALGSFQAGAGWTLGYNATLTNGRTVGQVDLSEDKALGGRLYTSTRSDGFGAQLGVSGYYGTYQEEVKNVVDFSPFTVDPDTSVDFTEWTLGADVSLDVGSFRLRTETTLRRVVFEEGLRLAASQGPPGSEEPDRYNWNAYLIGAYRLPWLGLEPYGYFEVLHGPNFLADTIFFPSVGTNVHFMPELQLKVQYGQTFFTHLVTEQEGESLEHDFKRLTARLVFVF